MVSMGGAREKKRMAAQTNCMTNHAHNARTKETKVMDMRV